jgi:hypothetical protein
MVPVERPLEAKTGFGHTRIWWLLNEAGCCKAASLMKDARSEQKQGYDRMLAILDHTDKCFPPRLPSQYKTPGGGLVETEVKGRGVRL